MPLACIRSLYSHFVCGALLLSAHLLSYYYVNVADESGYEGLSLVESIATSIAHSAVAKQISLLAVHVVIAVVVSCLLQGPQKPLLPILACYSLPVIARLADFPSDSLQVCSHVVLPNLSLIWSFIVFILRFFTTLVAHW